MANAGPKPGAPRPFARLTGLVGVAVLVSGSFAGVVASRLIVRDDIAATTHNIVGSERLFRLGIAGSLTMMVAYVFYGLLLYRLLRRVDPGQALAMLVLVLVSAPVYMLNQVNLFAVLMFAQDGLLEHAGVFLGVYRFGNLIAAIFFGLWLVPLGLLVFRSGFLPRLLGMLLLIGSPGYVVLFVQGFLFPGTERTLWSDPLLLLTHLAELSLMLWLLVKGVNAQRWSAQQTERGR